MALTVLNDVVMPNNVIHAGVRGKNMRNNTRSISQSGYQQVNINWSRTLRQYELGIVPMTVAQWQAIEGLHEVTEGGAYGFLMLDPKDQSALITEGLMQPMSGSTLVGTVGQGYGVPTLQLYKRYTSAGSTRTKDRKITRPKATPTLKRAGSTVTLGAGAGQAAINYDTGLVTFVADTSEAITSVAVGASTVLNFAVGTGIVAALGVGDRVYITGISGTAAATLNSLSHAITAKGATSLTVSTVTTGLTATGGTAFKYPQTSDAMTWSGSFYVPVHFMDDSIDWDMVRSGPADTRLLAGPSVVLQEVRE